MYKTVEKAIYRIAKEVRKETGNDITDFLFNISENYEYNDDGKKATCQQIINSLEYQADCFVQHINLYV